MANRSDVYLIRFFQPTILASIWTRSIFKMGSQNPGIPVFFTFLKIVIKCVLLKNDKKCHFFKLFSFFCCFRCSRSIPAARKQVFKKTKNYVCGGQRTPKSIKMQKRCGFKVRLLAKKRVYYFF